MKLYNNHSLLRPMQSLLVLAVIALGSSVFAQSDSSRAADTLKKYIKKEIVVTSTPIQQELLNVPMAISVVPQREFADERGYELKDALWSVPGVFAQARSGHSDLRITIRGFGSRGAGDRSNAGNMRGIRVMLDGIPETEPDGRTSLDIVDLNAISSVEVLRGNASSLFGSASGGVISLSSGSGSGQPSVEIRNAMGSFGYMKNSILTNSVFGSSKLFVALSQTQYDGYREHSHSSEGNFSLSLRSALSDATSFFLSSGASSNIFRFPGALTMAEFEANPLQANPKYVTQDDHRFNRVGRLGFGIDHLIAKEHDLGATLYYQPKVITRSERASWREFNRYTLGGNLRYGWSTQLSDDVANRLAAGYERQYQDGSIQFYKLTANAARDVLDQNKKEAAGVQGLYLEDRVIWNDFTFLLGGRFDWIEYSTQDFTKMDSSLGYRRPAPAQTKQFDHFSPKAAISYKLQPTHTLYASYGQGVEAPAFNEIDAPNSDSVLRALGGTPVSGAAFNPLLDIATSSTVELGVKGYELFDGFFEAIGYEVTGFMIKVDNDIIPWNDGRYYFTAGETKRSGLEISGALQTEIGLDLRTAITLMRSEYVKYENLLGSFDGNDIAGLPGMFTNTRLRYTTPFDLFIEGGIETVGEYYADDRNDKKADGSPDPTINSLVPAYTLFNVTAGYSITLGSFAIDLHAGLRNLTDEKYVSSAFINGIENRYFESGMPRNFFGGLNIAYKL